MLSEDRFPPVPFDTPKWLEFLKTIGLVHKVSQDLFKAFATEVAKEGTKGRTERTDKQSKVLVAHLFTRQNVVEEGLLQAVCDIKFVATDHVRPALRAVHQQFAERDDGQLPFISFNGSVLAKHAEIVWTTADILPEWANPRNYEYQISAPGWKRQIDATSKFAQSQLWTW